jgi:NAD(P)-dependent dehydrogenase (short-subunit alcohol dehydrogenase family)
MYTFKKSRILIAGGSSGIGLAAAKSFVSAGAEVIISGRNKDKLQDAVKEIKGNVSAYSFDALDDPERKMALETIGNIDHLIITLSGGKGGGTFSSLSCTNLRGAFESKFFAYAAIAQDSIRYLRKDGSITFVTAISARAANPGTAGLAAVNAAIEGMIKPLAVELKPLRINAVSPGVIDTPWWNTYDDIAKKKMFDDFAEKTPVGRIGAPEDIAHAILFLTGNTFMTGTVIECDGGMHLINQEL